MNYYVTTQGRDNITLFLVDRKKTKKHWWTMDLINAMAFRLRSAAEYSANRLKYKNPCVVDYNEAKKMEQDNTWNLNQLEVHPFSSDALGQD